MRSRPDGRPLKSPDHRRASPHESGRSAPPRHTGPRTSRLCQHSASIKSEMPTLTIRNVPATIVRSLKALARRRNHSMEHEVREMLETYVSERRSLLDQIQASYARQTRRPTAREINNW